MEVWQKTGEGYIKFGQVNGVWAVIGGGEDEFNKAIDPIVVDEMIGGKKVDEEGYSFDELSNKANTLSYSNTDNTDNTDNNDNNDNTDLQWDTGVGGGSGGDPFGGGDVYYQTSAGSWTKYKWSPERNKFTSHGVVPKDNIPSNAITYHSKEEWNEATGAETSGGETTYGGQSDWGGANISKDDFINVDGTPKTIDEIYAILDPKLPGITGGPLRQQITQMAPKYQGVSEEEKGFERDAMKGDVYDLSKKAREAGTQMRTAYDTGMGTGIRGAVTAGEDIAQGFKETQQGYQESIYDLEKGAEKSFESDIGHWLDTSWFEEPTEAKEGGYVREDASGVGDTYSLGNRFSNNKNGKQDSFSSFLTQLPDAGGN